MSILGMEQVLAVFEEELKGKGAAASTVVRYRLEYRRFMRFCRTHGMTDMREIAPHALHTYIREVQERYSYTTVRHSITVLTQVFRLLYTREKILTNPMDQLALELPKVYKEKRSMTEEEMLRFLDSITPTTLYRLRDRALFEVLYVTGMRSGECTALKVDDIDTAHREVFIREGKGRRDRIVPVGMIGIRWVKKWMTKGLPHFARQDRGLLFVTNTGRALNSSYLWRMFRLYLHEAGIAHSGITIHSIRHSCATHLLEHGADIRYVQELLGHESIETTTLYTKGIASKLQTTQRRYHPRENELYEEE